MQNCRHLGLRMCRQNKKGGSVMGADNETIFDLADIDEGKVKKNEKEREWDN